MFYAPSHGSFLDELLLNQASACGNWLKRGAPPAMSLKQDKYCLTSCAVRLQPMPVVFCINSFQRACAAPFRQVAYMGAAATRFGDVECQLFGRGIVECVVMLWRWCGGVVGCVWWCVLVDVVCECGCEFHMELDVLLFCCLFLCI